ncbi:aspartate-semialdehyde dehydrogenase [Patescibacteria group bacterium]|nr:aspartate-semialdehyde dehydrogenase [Patescibacteria group bacterium]MBU1931923.1 aspartate-semialdehyde dehydrogenase [Patescibacteria group bacterium]
MSKKLRVGILGATGSVGQRFIQLLENHPWFKVTAVAASERSAGKLYGEAVNWKMTTCLSHSVAQLKIKLAKPPLKCDFVFSGLDAVVAGEIEEEFAQAGYPVISNSKNHRFDPDVPLLIPDVNPDHITIIDYQRKQRGYTTGFIATSPNCSTIGLVMALKPLDDKFGVSKVIVTTMQAISGAGYPGLPSMDIIDNVIPYIGGEEEKVETEPLKLLAKLKRNRFELAKIKISAHCNRVHVLDGHLESVSVKLKNKTSLNRVVAAFKNYRSEPQKLKLPSAPEKPVIVKNEPDRPQTRMDRDTDKGMATTVGRIRPCPIFDYRFTVLSHNTIRGAAGGAILNAELLFNRGYLKLL